MKSPGAGLGRRPEAVEYELVRWSVCTRALRDVTTDYARALLAGADATRLIAAQSRLGVQGVSAPRLLELAPDHLAEPLGTALATYRSMAAALGARQRLATIAVLLALEASGIPAVPLKGVLLTERLYGDVSARVSGDIDVLVDPADLPRAIAVAREFGYGPPGDPVDQRGLPRLHFALPADTILELHWRVHWYEERFASRALARANPLLRPGDEFAMLLLFHARDGFAGLRQAADLAAWWDRFGGDGPAAAVRRVADEEPALRRALATAAAVAKRTIGLPDPWEGHGAVELAARLANWRLDGSEDRWRADVSLIDLLLTPPGGRLATLRRHMLVPLPEITGWERPVAPGRLRRRMEQALRPGKLGVRWITRLTPRNREL